ncbi:hypothetical protein H0H92_015970, partial [Tricholoma furcatifolium]
MPRDNRGRSHGHPTPYEQGGRQGRRAPPDPQHPWMRQDRDTQMIHINRPGRTRYSVHPLQMQEYISFDRRVRESAVHMHRNMVMPIGYLQVAEIHNAIPSRQYPYRMVTYD